MRCRLVWRTRGFTNEWVRSSARLTYNDQCGCCWYVHQKRSISMTAIKPTAAVRTAYCKSKMNNLYFGVCIEWAGGKKKWEMWMKRNANQPAKLWSRNNVPLMLKLHKLEAIPNHLLLHFVFQAFKPRLSFLIIRLYSLIFDHSVFW